MRHCTTGIKTHIDSNHVHLVPPVWTLISNDAQRLVYEKQCSPTLLTVLDVRSVPQPVFLGTTPHFILHSFLRLSQLSILHLFSATSFFTYCTIFCTTWWWLTMTRFYPPSSWRHIYHAVELSVDSTTVLPTMTPHNTAVSTTVLIAHHFLCPAIVRAHVSLPLQYITTNYGSRQCPLFPKR